jgi:hypothetical protein
MLDRLSLQRLSQVLDSMAFSAVVGISKTKNCSSHALFSHTFPASIALEAEIFFDPTAVPLFGAGEQLPLIAFDENDSCA